jgi:hypothetical protein
VAVREHHGESDHVVRNACSGRPDEYSAPTGSSAYLGVDRVCFLPTGGANGYGYVVLAMTHVGFRTWQISWVAPA